MAFLGGGAECSTAGNPLSQFSKHVQDDKSRQHDRLVGRGPNGSLGVFRGAGRSTPQDEVMNGFLHQTPSLPEMAVEQGHMGPGVIIDPSLGVHLRAKSTSPAWAADDRRGAGQAVAMEAAFNVPPGTHFSPEDFARFRQMNHPSSARSSPMPTAAEASSAQARPMMGVDMMNRNMHYGMMSRPMYQPMSMYQAQMPLHQQQRQQEPEGKGKGKVIELDDNKWEEHFAQIELEDTKATQDESLAMEPELNQMDEQMLHSETGFGDLESIWQGIQAEQAHMRSMDDIEDKVDDFDINDFGWPTSIGGWDIGNSRIAADPLIEEYLFEEENIFESHNDPFEEGVRIMNEAGNLSLAALAFEAAVQKDPDHVEAWVYLGTAQAQNEKEDAALRALEHALKLDPNNLTALMGLAVSYTNEGYDSTAYRTLERWLSVKYPQIISPDNLSSAADMGFTDKQLLHEKVTNLFIQAAQLSPNGAQMDPDVQVGLGVLFYGAEEFDKAVDCFESALHSTTVGSSNQRSQVHLLWNRLGATLANSGRPEEATHAYEKALTLNLNFVRARYNLGVSCINMGCYQQAADHLLLALEMHKAVEKSGREKARQILSGGGGSGGGDAVGATDAVSDEYLDRVTAQNRSTTLYDTLRRVFTQMGRRDLAEKVVAGVDPEIFRGQFDV